MKGKGKTAAHAPEAPEDKTAPAPGSAPETAPAAATTGEAQEQLLDEAQREMDAMKDRLLRLQADFDNFRKRVRRDAEDQRVAAAEGIMTDLLPVLDHFELGLKSAEEQALPADVLDGFRMIQGQMLAALGRFGLEPVAAAPGDAFDPTVHESASVAPSAEVPRDHVLAEIRRGYRLGARLLRAPQVVVSIGAPGAEAE
jgi:molecular chaperone GrpE